MSRTTVLRFSSVIPIIFSIAACSAEVPAEQAEAPVEPTENPGVEATPLTEDDSGQAAAEQTKATGWCSTKEPVIFSCQLKSRKVVSVCGTENGAGIKAAQYRFGTHGKSPELVWPAAAGKDRLSFSSVPYSGGGEAQLSFSRGDVTYVVYSRMVRTNFKAGEPNNPEMTDGVMVLKGKQTVSDLVCADPDVVPVNYDLASAYADKSDDAFIIPGE
ncbi:hypothetical protein [Sphingorhabdus sp. M41]|uniref:hypothetical protein n=1 Tax=Sphingorhabdus sp. M41 TaxID=1806885 RepID=UPI00078ED690|nr:hypothetical protein [Sphingorhabdus sp. M41]AMO71860.1 hypothetical protein AZE99_08350 [Sphingorhabdus sp. M41]